MAEIHAWLAGNDGYYAGEIDSPNSADDWDTFAANCAKNGQTPIDKTAEGAERPPDRPGIANPAASAYATATTDSAKLDAIAQRLGLK